MADFLPTLYAVPSSHPCFAVEAAMKAKGIEYRRVDLIPVLHMALQKVRFGQATVPGLELEGERIVGSRRIMKRLDGLVADPALYPADPEALAKVEAAEAWGDEVLQPVPRRISWALLKRAPEAIPSFTADAKLPLPDLLLTPSGPLVAQAQVRIFHADDDTVRADVIALPAQLDRIDAWIADGTLGGEVPNAAAYQIASSLRLLLNLADVATLIEGRPCEALARRLFPDYPGHVPAGTMPAEWLTAARAAA